MTATPHLDDGDVKVYAGDCIEVMAALPAESIDAVVCDPPYALTFMGRGWDAYGPAEFQTWCTEWAAQALRVLKPGGHLLAFGGTRTFHRLTSGLEDAGFEIRDCLSWLYGSGFPKSLDVSKAIDKTRDDRAAIVRVTAWLKAQADAAGVSRSDVDRHMGTSDMAGWWLTDLPHRCQVPTWDQWGRLRDLIGFGADMDAEVWRLNGRKGQPGEAWQLRPITQEASAPLNPGAVISFDQRSSSARERRDIAATDAAREWEGWGTALKPAYEPVVVAVKPHTASAILSEIGSHLDTIEAWLAQAAEQTTRTGAAGVSPGATGTSPSAWTVTTFSNTVTSWRACWDELSNGGSTSTTATESSTTTDLRTLNCSLSAITRVSTTPDLMSEHGWRSLVMGADGLFAAAVMRSRAIRALSVTAPATDGTLTSPLGGDERPLSPAWEPIVLARKPLTGTVAANVQQHGTGALNISGCRIGTEGGGAACPGGDLCKCSTNKVFGATKHPPRDTTVQVGRWPANVVLDPDAARMLDDQAGDTGGPSRFFKVVKEDECLSLPGNASTADGSSSPPISPEGSAPSDAVTPPSPVVEPVSSYPERSTTGTESASSASVASGTQTTPNTVPASSPVRLPDEHIPTPSPASSAGSSARTATTTTTASPSPSVGSAADATFASTPPPVLGVDAPGTSRTFYTAKASTSERNNGHGPANTHPTVKPVDLMRWCIRLVTPPGGLVLDPFAGSGTTGVAARAEGMRCVLIEREAEYLPIIAGRLSQLSLLGDVA